VGAALSADATIDVPPYAYQRIHFHLINCHVHVPAISAVGTVSSKTGTACT
jgi:hypothetical protein